MNDAVVLEVREEKAPLWAVLAPLAYLLACAGCIRSVVMDSSIDLGISGVLVAVGFVPAFALPAIFATRSTRISASVDGLLVDGDLVKTNSARITRTDRGAARLQIELRSNATRTFLIPSHAAAQSLLSQLPPASLPSLSPPSLTPAHPSSPHSRRPLPEHVQ